MVANGDGMRCDSRIPLVFLARSVGSKLGAAVADLFCGLHVFFKCRLQSIGNRQNGTEVGASLLLIGTSRALCGFSCALPTGTLEERRAMAKFSARTPG